jgi:hypothetical protein
VVCQYQHLTTIYYMVATTPYHLMTNLPRIALSIASEREWDQNFLITASSKFNFKNRFATDSYKNLQRLVSYLSSIYSNQIHPNLVRNSRLYAVRTKSIKKRVQHSGASGQVL